jgi:hypothetical protein
MPSQVSARSTRTRESAPLAKPFSPPSLPTNRAHGRVATRHVPAAGEPPQSRLGGAAKADAGQDGPHDTGLDVLAMRDAFAGDMPESARAGRLPRLPMPGGHAQAWPRARRAAELDRPHRGANGARGPVAGRWLHGGNTARLRPEAGRA